MGRFRAEQLIEAEILEKLLKQDYEIQGIELNKDYFKYEISREDLFEINIFHNDLETVAIQNKLAIKIHKDINSIIMSSYIDNTLSTIIYTKKENELLFNDLFI